MRSSLKMTVLLSLAYGAAAFASQPAYYCKNHYEGHSFKFATFAKQDAPSPTFVSCFYSMKKQPNGEPLYYSMHNNYQPKTNKKGYFVDGWDYVNIKSGTNVYANCGDSHRTMQSRNCPIVQISSITVR